MDRFQSWWTNAVEARETRVQVKESAALSSVHNYFQDAARILEDIDEYESFWIKEKGCVWSECYGSNGQFDDDTYKGDDRDGDEVWYQYRTQDFCANSAFELYGKRKDDTSLVSRYTGCTQMHYIDSFFTYGGADNLLWSLGITPTTFDYSSTYYGGGGEGGGEQHNGDGGSSNNVCFAIDYDAILTKRQHALQTDDVQEQEQQQEGENRENDRDGRRVLREDQDGDDSMEYTATLGCRDDGSYTIAAFESSSCDGNTFLSTIDNFSDYNAQQKSLKGCQRIYDINTATYVDQNGQQGQQASNTEIYTLLQNSWSCDVGLYPNSCPDPFGAKHSHHFALQSASRRGNVQWAYRSASARRPLNITTMVLATLMVAVLFKVSFVKNRRRILSKGGGFTGYFRMVGEDLGLWCSLVFHKVRSSCFAALGQPVTTSGKEERDDKTVSSAVDLENGYVLTADDQVVTTPTVVETSKKDAEDYTSSAPVNSNLDNDVVLSDKWEVLPPPSASDALAMLSFEPVTPPGAIVQPHVEKTPEPASPIAVDQNDALAENNLDTSTATTHITSDDRAPSANVEACDDPTVEEDLPSQESNAKIDIEKVSNAINADTVNATISESAEVSNNDTHAEVGHVNTDGKTTSTLATPYTSEESGKGETEPEAGVVAKVEDDNEKESDGDLVGDLVKLAKKTKETDGNDAGVGEE